VQKVRVLGDDRTAPAAAAISTAYVAPWYAMLNFNAVGGDAVWYDVRHSSSGPIATASAFENADPSYIPYAPAGSGASELITASGLQPGNTWYLAMRIYDAGGNYWQSPNMTVNTSTRIPVGHLIPYAGFATSDNNSITRNDGNPAVVALLGPAKSLAVDATGYLYVTAVVPDFTQSSLLRRIDPKGGIITTAAGFLGSGYAGDGALAKRATLNVPLGVAVDSAGNMFMADTGNNRIRRVDAVTGIITTIAGTGAAGYSGDNGPAVSAAINAPYGITADTAGNIYFAERGNNIIRKISAAGVITTICGTGTAGYNGDNIAATSAQLNGPADVKLDRSGNIYITEQLGYRIRRIAASTGLITTVAGTGTAGAGAENVVALGMQVNAPAGLAVDPLGSIYFSERDGQRVRRITTAGIAATVAGTGTAGTAATGPAALSAQLSSPLGLAGDWARGVLYIADASRVSALGIAPVNVITDTTPPVSMAYLDGLQYKVFGLMVISTATHVVLTSSDTAGTGASGLKTITYEVTDLNASSTTATMVYSSSFTLAQGAFLIRFRGMDNAGNIETSKELRVAVTPWLESALIAASTVTGTGNISITGAVTANSLVALTGSSKIYGNVTAGAITTSGTASITGARLSGSANPLPLYLPDLIQTSSVTNNNAVIKSYLTNGALTLSGNTSLTLSSGTYFLKGITLGGSSKVLLSSHTELVVDGNVAITGNASMNKGGAAANLSVFVSTGHSVEVANSGVLSACMYAPSSALTLSGNVMPSGHYFVNNAVISGSSGITMSTETATGQMVRAAFAGGFTPLASAAFVAGEAYVYPNPTRGHNATFHFECGVADNAEVTVFDISGHRVYGSDMGSPQIPSGSGKYAYVNTWNTGNTASGVYIYILHAQKAGQGTIVKKGKVAVIH
jgi:sugar lactone lactonase YvrE/cytoskeletal protein CcmA (bactofilin family)